MKRALFLSTVFVLSAIGFGVAFADAGAAAADSAPPISLPSGWAGVMLAICVFGSWLLRKATRSSTGKVAAFLHSSAGAAAASALSAILSALTQALQSHGLDLKTLETAVLGALFSFMASDNSSNTSAEQATKVAAMRSSGVSNGPGPTIQKVGALLLPVLFLFSVSGCTPFNQCIKASGIASAGTIESQVGGVLSNAVDSPSVIAALENVATAALPVLGQDAFVAVECAINAWKAEHPLPKLSSPSPRLYAAHQGANEWIFRHFTQPQS